MIRPEMSSISTAVKRPRICSGIIPIKWPTPAPNSPNSPPAIPAFSAIFHRNSIRNFGV